MNEDSKTVKLTNWNNVKIKYANAAIVDDTTINQRRNAIKNDNARELVFQKNIYWADLGENIGHELNKIRPVLVVSKNIYNRTGNVVVIPLSTGPVLANKHMLNCWYKLYKRTYPQLERDSILKTEAIRSISIERLTNSKDISPSETDVSNIVSVCHVNSQDWKRIQGKIKYLIN
ncbi:type II toxin-antitoxin system PemK/MazF family toxin [Lactiplantibacillus plantarum]|uniref:type II toxin-antitoxin system PemK/MazF family toxin n=2 Tax=Lactiplantibacillus plantarum TaxID=1590 RepID=UPI000534F29E|nr:type II toxin-antitoxin system PemK/MazF family toxin [Lactiplantibacillus plantarum]ASX22179.1 hypothetical protein BGV74_10520 [Lactiplantibacillus plantarum]MCG0687134.1 Endoribonuclease EndoA [Lactiplantibacillus plantarum]MCH8625653.1 type II toxin-antitoxin system PemK/MazF family toxin [Lactiplantibacillus plantarum]MCH8632097.1 type II toxin-antitoxin system PemK/MazF family toxin [Lactiplantibacillus plantarum]MCH8635099.1 type II toxin-antitoxin system PemK/MazF family toxin [Lact